MALGWQTATNVVGAVVLLATYRWIRSRHPGFTLSLARFDRAAALKVLAVGYAIVGVFAVVTLLIYWPN